MTDVAALAVKSGKSEAEAQALQEDVEFVRVVVYILATVTLGAAFYYFGIVWLNTLFYHNYTKGGTPPVPGAFTSTRYSFTWFTVAVMIFNVFPPYLLVLMALYPVRRVFSDVHLVVLFVSVFANLFTFAVMLWWVCTANSSAGPFNAANDYRYCGVYYATAIDRCPNTTPFVPPVAASELTINAEFRHHLWAPLVALGWALLVQLLVNLRLRYYLRGIRKRFL